MFLRIMNQFTVKHLQIICNKFPISRTYLIVRIILLDQSNRITLCLQNTGLAKQILYGFLIFSASLCEIFSMYSNIYFSLLFCVNHQFWKTNPYSPLILHQYAPFPPVSYHPFPPATKQQFFQIFYGLNRLFIRDKSAIHDIFLSEFLQLFFV